MPISPISFCCQCFPYFPTPGNFDLSRAVYHTTDKKSRLSLSVCRKRAQVMDAKPLKKHFPLCSPVFDVFLMLLSSQLLHRKPAKFLQATPANNPQGDLRLLYNPFVPAGRAQQGKCTPPTCYMHIQTQLQLRRESTALPLIRTHLF